MARLHAAAARDRCYGTAASTIRCGRELFAHAGFKLASFLFMVALLYHAWIGMRDILMDYIKPAGMRLLLETVTVVVLVALSRLDAADSLGPKR